MFNLLQFKNRSLEEQLVLLGTSITFFILITFALYRFFIGDLTVAAIDLAMALLMLLLFAQSFRKKKLKFLNQFAVGTFMIGILAVMYIKGPEMIFWTFPAMSACYFLLQSKQALLANVVLICGVTVLFFSYLTKPLIISIYPSLILVCLFGYIFSIRSEKQNKELFNLVTKDSLTGVQNRRSFDDKVEEILASYKRVPKAVSMLLLDLDYFKKVNDKFGHHIGDQVLKDFAQLVKSRIRETDYIYRYGGEEFVVLLKNSDLDNSADLANSIRKQVQEDQKLSRYNVTVSIGVAELRKTDYADTWFSRADLALYESKSWGRNLVSMADLNKDKTVSTRTLDKYRNLELYSSKPNLKPPTKPESNDKHVNLQGIAAISSKKSEHTKNLEA